MILAHHGFGEEIILGSLAAGGTTAATGLLLFGRAKLDAIAHAHNASPGQVALAWLLQRSPVMLPIPGTGKVKHLEENVAAVNITLTDAQFADLKGLA